MEETFKGLTQTLITRDAGRPFEVNQYICSNCGLKDDYQEHESLCHKCKSELDKTRKTARTIKSKEVKKVIDNQLVYKCPECRKIYNVPTLCCNGEFVADSKTQTIVTPYGRKYVGFMCMGCKTIYRKPTRCCSGSQLVRGDVYPDMSQEEYKKIRTGLSKPIEAIVQ